MAALLLLLNPLDCFSQLAVQQLHSCCASRHCNPAKQTRDREEIDYALKRYLDMNKLAIQAVAPGGLYLTCSCTGLIGEETFLETLRRAAWQANRVVQVIKLSGAGPDHPFQVHAQEGRYLKAVWCRVE